MRRYARAGPCFASPCAKTRAKVSDPHVRLPHREPPCVEPETPASGCLICSIPLLLLLPRGGRGAWGPLRHCWNDMGLIERPYCERLGTPFERDRGAGMIRWRPPRIRPFSAGRGRSPATRRDRAGLVNRLKYHDRLELAEPMGRWMARAGAELLAEADVLVPTRCTGCASPPGASTSRPSWRGSSRARARFRSKRGAGAGEADGAAGGAHAPQRAANLAGAFRVDKARAGRNLGPGNRAGRRVSPPGRPPTPPPGPCSRRRGPRGPSSFRADRDRRVISCIEAPP